MDELHPGPPYRTGGPFWQYVFRTPYVVAAQANYKRLSAFLDARFLGYDGGFVLANLPPLAELPSKGISNPDEEKGGLNKANLSSLGNVAYMKLRPKVEVASVFQDAMEARDIPRMLKTSSEFYHAAWSNLVLGSSGGRRAALKVGQMLPKKTGDHFLNVQFGWKPFLKSLRDVIKVTQNLQDYIERAERTNNTWVHRRYAEEPVESSSQVYRDSRDYSSPLFKSYFYPSYARTGSRSTLVVMRQGLTRVWYEGRFKSYRPEFDKAVSYRHRALREIDQALTLYGARVSPTSIWKVTPWTWLADWFVNVSGNMQALQDQITNSVVSEYMYLMREEVDQYQYTASLSMPSNPTISGTGYRSVTVKRRVAAESPFGFTLLPGGLSGMQLAILSALGLSKLAP